MVETHVQNHTNQNGKIYTNNEEVLDLEDKVELTYNNDIKKTKLVEQNQYSKV